MALSLKKLLSCGFVPHNVDLGLLALRIWVGASLFLRHGFEKPTNFSQMAAHFPDPLHIGAVPSLMFALVSDAVCSILVMLGVATRWAAAVIFVNIFVAWSLVHHFQFFGRGADHGELMVLYLGVYLALAIAGPGRYSVDRRFLSGK
jgi:putative oxidoreductase